MLHIGAGSVGKAHSARRETLTGRVLQRYLLSIEFFRVLKGILSLTTIYNLLELINL